MYDKVTVGRICARSFILYLILIKLCVYGYEIFSSPQNIRHNLWHISALSDCCKYVWIYVYILINLHVTGRFWKWEGGGFPSFHFNSLHAHQKMGGGGQLHVSSRFNIVNLKIMFAARKRREATSPLLWCYMPFPSHNRWYVPGFFLGFTAESSIQFF